MTPTTISAWVRAARTARGWTVRELARQAGTTPMTASRVEHGRTDPTLSTLTAILGALDAELVIVEQQ